MHQSYVDRLRKELCCKIVNKQMFNRLNGTNADYQVSDIGPSEFLGLIRKAKWVCTDSFHAIIFSYIFQRRISVFERLKSTDTQSQNSRIYTLLNILDLEKVLVRNDSVCNMPERVEHLGSCTALEKWKDLSLEFIRKALK